MLRQLVLDLHRGARFERVYEKHYGVLSGPISLTEIFVPLFLHTHQTKSVLRMVFWSDARVLQDFSRHPAGSNECKLRTIS
jgi:hypothetical protein